MLAPFMGGHMGGSTASPDLAGIPLIAGLGEMAQALDTPPESTHLQIGYGEVTS